MSLGQSLVISGMGILIVVGALALLAIAIIVLSKIVGVLTGGEKKAAAAPAPAAAPAAPVNNLDEEAYAVLIAAVSEETHMPLTSFQITEIKEIG
ncbi:OadG family transporter subunit [Pygmaiobacter massiliensis]|nr:OadG family transporter subunit [Pygmaiobacter massiliensis]